MTKSANEVMQEIIFSAAIDAIRAFKAASQGLPNNLLRDLNAVHANTTFADLPNEVKAAITESVRAGFTRLLKEGYSVSAGPPARPQPFGRGPTGGGRGPERPPGRGGRPDRGGPPRKGPRPERGPKPRSR